MVVASGSVGHDLPSRESLARDRFVIPYHTGSRDIHFYAPFLSAVAVGSGPFSALGPGEGIVAPLTADSLMSLQDVPPDHDTRADSGA